MCFILGETIFFFKNKQTLSQNALIQVTTPMVVRKWLKSRHGIIALG